MVVDEKLIKYLEDLSFITLSDEERVRIAGDLEKILDGMALLSKLDTKGLTEKDLSFGNANALRKDIVIPSFPRGEILKNAPEVNDESFIVPKAVE